ncbi:hypothetical protein L0657_27595 [Dyadobacter sp. CY345]|uniref:hypothetical protein n=1 Tax=Dyadobacter sp. CY345 TaxID=2909335 RepID=UPI001F2756AB|nr:hypothetical protein [Dyadobacter sp. CY345]MCF2447750.1 hypothetical protein [Dyadobacter sp. CY345]
METREEFKAHLQALIADTDLMIQDAKSYLISQGEVVDLTDWVTIKEYCKRFDIRNTETVTNWISRGIIPAENVRTIEEFNNTRLVKAVPYLLKEPK